MAGIAGIARGGTGSIVGRMLNTKEELLYCRAFRDRFGALDNLPWMGRTKGAPVE
jgi:hypothetical protein